MSIDDDWGYRRLLEWNSAPADNLEIVFTPHSLDPLVWLQPSTRVGANLMGPPGNGFDRFPAMGIADEWEFVFAIPYQAGVAFSTGKPGLQLVMHNDKIRVILWDTVGPRVLGNFPAKESNLIFVSGSPRIFQAICNGEYAVLDITGMRDREGHNVSLVPDYHAFLCWQRNLTDRERELLTRHFEEKWAPLQTQVK